MSSESLETNYRAMSTMVADGERQSQHALGSLPEQDSDDKDSDDKDVDEKSKTADDTELPQYVTGFRLAMIICTLNLTTLIGALDLGIIATAIPKITDDFHSLDNIGWYSAACFLLVGATSAMYGKLYKYLPAQYVYITSLAIYIVGSLIAALAPNSIALIVARAIQGIGCSGTLGGSVLIINFTVEPKRRPLIIGLWMGVFMGSTILGPLLGGVFTTEVTWRWCFWINLPVGGLAIALQVLFLRIPKHIKPAPATWRELVLQLDLPGFALILTSMICLILAMQWGGQAKSWSDGSVIATLVMWPVLTIAFFVVEWLQGLRAMMPLSLLKPRIVWSYCLYAWIANAANFQVIIYLPLYFQSIKGQSAIISGVYTLPFVAFYAAGALCSGAIIGKTHLLQPIALVSALLATLGVALLHEMDINTAKAWFIGAQIPFGFGIGLGNQLPVTALQAFSKPEDVAMTTGVVFMWQTMSGAYFVVTAQAIFDNILLQTLARIAPTISTERVLAAGAFGLQQSFKGAELAAVLEAYSIGIKDIFAFGIACSAAAAVLSMIIPFKRLPSDEDKPKTDPEAVPEA